MPQTLKKISVVMTVEICFCFRQFVFGTGNLAIVIFFQTIRIWNWQSCNCNFCFRQFVFGTGNLAIVIFFRQFVFGTGNLAIACPCWRGTTTTSCAHSSTRQRTSSSRPPLIRPFEFGTFQVRIFVTSQ